MSDFDKKTDDAMRTLDMIETAVAKSAGSYDEQRARADEVFERRVEQLAELHGVDMAKAYSLATTDELAKRAYRVSAELAERQGDARDGGGQIAAYIE